MQFLKNYGYSELDLAGIGLIMRDVSIEFKGELFYGDTVKASVAAGEFTAISFDIYYKLEITRADKTILAATARTGMVGYDYQKKKVVAIPEQSRNVLLAQ
jgi:acyl-CoA thioesterase FadM